MKTLLLGLRQRLKLNAALQSALLVQAWSVVSGPLTLLFVARSLTIPEQGYYYTFNSLVSILALVDLGLGTAIVQVASHSKAELYTAHERAVARIGSLLRLSLRWYVLAAAIGFIGLAVGGYLFFGARDPGGTHWQLSWLALCATSTAMLAFAPLVFVLEGYHDVSSAYTCRLIQAFTYSVALIVALVFRAQLLALAIAYLFRLLITLWFLAAKHGSMFLKLYKARGHEMQWSREIWPLQWRLALSWVGGYTLQAAMIPSLFYFQGARSAAQAGITLAVLNAVASASYAWIQVRLAPFGTLIASGQCRRVNCEFLTLFKLVLLIAVVANGFAVGATMLIYHTGAAFSNRIMPPGPTAVLAFANIQYTVLVCLALYTRAHKQETLTATFLVSGALSSITVIACSRYSPLDASYAYALVLGCVAVPWSIIIALRTSRRQLIAAQKLTDTLNA